MAENQSIVIKKKKGGGHGGHHGGAWKVAYADFVTAMMCFFLVMWLLGADEETKAIVSHYFNHPNTPFKDGRDPQSKESRPLGEREGSGNEILKGLAGQTPDELVEKAARPVNNQAPSKQLAEIGELARDVLDDQLFGLEVEVDTLRFSIPEDLLFKPESTELNEKSPRYLDRLGKIFKVFPGKIKIQGHSDQAGTTGSTFEFSMARAVNIMKFLVEKNYAEEDRLLPAGVGSLEPYSSANTETAQRKNRRIQFILTKSAGPPSK